MKRQLNIFQLSISVVKKYVNILVFSVTICNTYLFLFPTIAFTLCSSVNIKPSEAKDICLTNFKFLVYRSLMLSDVIFYSLSHLSAIPNQLTELPWVESSLVFDDVQQQTQW